MAILSVNAGSSSLKFALYPLTAGEVQPAQLTGLVQGLEPQGSPELCWRVPGQAQQQRSLPADAADPFAMALAQLRQLLEGWRQADGEALRLAAVAHRVVHGGHAHKRSCRVDAALLQTLAELNSLAPLHQPHNLAGIRAFAQAFAQVPQIACFDTAFHTTVPEVETRFALPQALSAQGIRRYGFHGLSYQFIMASLQRHSARAQGRVLMAHLGNGASLCAAQAGRSCATTMGFSALDGLMMGSRCGAIDPGVLLYLMEQGWDHDRLQSLLYKQSGLLGVSGLSADMRRLRAEAGAQAQAAQQAIELFTHRVVRESGAMVACLQGLDVLAFSGGIGEHDALLREQVCARLAWLGLRIDPALNAAAVGDQVVAIHQSGSAIEVWVVPTDEGWVSAQEAARVLSGAA
jgi:acetate kinase